MIDDRGSRPDAEWRRIRRAVDLAASVWAGVVALLVGAVFVPLGPHLPTPGTGDVARMWERIVPWLSFSPLVVYLLVDLATWLPLAIGRRRWRDRQVEEIAADDPGIRALEPSVAEARAAGFAPLATVRFQGAPTVLLGDGAALVVVMPASALRQRPPWGRADRARLLVTLLNPSSISGRTAYLLTAASASRRRSFHIPAIGNVVPGADVTTLVSAHRVLISRLDAAGLSPRPVTPETAVEEIEQYGRHATSGPIMALATWGTGVWRMWRHPIVAINPAAHPLDQLLMPIIHLAPPEEREAVLARARAMPAAPV